MLYRWLTPSVLILRPRRLKVFHTFHGHIFHGYYSSLKTRLFVLIEKALAFFATDKIVVISNKQFSEIHDENKVGSAGQFKIIPLGLDLSALSFESESERSFRQEFGIGQDELLVGLVGRLTEIKNHRLFIDAVRQISEKKDFPSLRFVIIGDGHLRREFEEYAAGTGIIFAGNRNDPNAFYSALDIVALTSLNEGTPLSLIEAMAFGIPWVSTNVGGVADLAGPGLVGTRGRGDGETGGRGDAETRSDSGLGECDPALSESNSGLHPNGIIFESGSVEGLVGSLKMLCDDAELRKRLGENGKRFVLQQYTKERLVSDIRGLYLESTNG